MNTVGQRVAAAEVDAVVVCTPHGVHVAEHLCVVTAARASGVIEGDGAPVSVSCAVDRDLAIACTAAISSAGVPVVAVSYGGNDPVAAVMPLDWGAAIPLWHILRHAPHLRTVIVSPARDLNAGAHVEAGAAIARAAQSVGRRIAFIASADQGHGHSASSPYGWHAESVVFDRRITALVRSGELERLVDIDAAEVHAAVADSWWQMLMLLGALRETATEYRSEVLAYEAPTYYGMLTAVVTPGETGSG